MLASNSGDLRARQAQLARDAAIQATITLLQGAEPGATDEVTMPEVARAAGISLRTLYRHFPTRDALLRGAGARVQSQLALPIEVTGPHDIPATFWAASARMAEHPQLARALARSRAGRTAHAATRSARIDAIHDALGTLTAPLPAQRARQIEAVITYLCGSAAWVGVADESRLPDEDARAGVRWALSVLLDAAGAEAGTTAPSHHQEATTMSISMTCGPCGTVITGADEDDLVTRVQTHAREHDNTEVPREHTLAHLHGEHPDEPELQK